MWDLGYGSLSIPLSILGFLGTLYGHTELQSKRCRWNCVYQEEWQGVIWHNNSSVRCISIFRAELKVTGRWLVGYDVWASLLLCFDMS